MVCVQGFEPWCNAQCYRYSDYYISGCKLFAKDVGASFLMSFVACGRPFPVTQHPGNPLPLSGQPCTAQSPCCGGAGRHDSHYVCVKFKGGYFPCPAREQPDYDEIVTFNANAVLPVAAFEFKRRRRTLLWLDDNPQNNFSILRTFPGCPRHSSMLQVQGYPMQQHCTACSHGLSMDPNPSATAKQCRKVVQAAQAELDRLHAAARAGHVVEQERLKECTDAMQLADAALTSAKAAAAAVVGEFAGRDISMEEQTDVVLFTSVGDMTRFLQLHPEFRKGHPPPPPRLHAFARLHLEAEGWRMLLLVVRRAEAAVQVPTVAAAHNQQPQAAARGQPAALFRHRRNLAPQVRGGGGGGSCSQTTHSFGLQVPCNVLPQHRC